MRTYLEIYFGLNILMFGFKIGDRSILGSYNTSGKVVEIIVAFLILLFGVIIEIVYPLFRYCVLIPIDRVVNISFYVQYLFNKKYAIFTKSYLNEWNDRTIKYHQSGSLRDKHWRFITKMINKRNNYTFVPDQPETE